MSKERRFFAPVWGSTQSFELFVAEVVKAGFDGIEMALLGDSKEIEDQLQLLHDNDLSLIAQQWISAFDADFDSHKISMQNALTQACQYHPLKINTQTGKDFFSFQQNCELIEIAENIAAKAGIQLVHEIHRSRFNAHPKLLEPYLDKYPSLLLTADFSHWCCVCESLLEEQDEMLARVIPHVRHVHARVGYSQGPQVNDFLAKENEGALLQHLKWWDAIVKYLDGRNFPVSFTPEFGPTPYMPTLPHTQMPVSDQWSQNVEMMKLLRKRYSN